MTRGALAGSLAAVAFVATAFSGRADPPPGPGSHTGGAPAPGTVPLVLPAALPVEPPSPASGTAGAPAGIPRAGADHGSAFRLPGDPDSVFSPGGPSPSGKLKLLAAVEVNDVVLKSITPDPTIAPSDTRTRAPGSWAPLDAAGRPYQLRLGARLVW